MSLRDRAKWALARNAATQIRLQYPFFIEAVRNYLILNSVPPVLCVGGQFDITQCSDFKKVLEGLQDQKRKLRRRFLPQLSLDEVDDLKFFRNNAAHRSTRVLARKWEDYFRAYIKLARQLNLHSVARNLEASLNRLQYRLRRINSHHFV